MDQDEELKPVVKPKLHLRTAHTESTREQQVEAAFSQDNIRPIMAKLTQKELKSLGWLAISPVWL
ncbi:hypothetical protein OESDEN_24280 [Oesophagostomum dentatum]|uniref:Uncharacterized protein n=1 Tax=Oesophagostomum dentatum TaxID=61180 RepID=A0A0B1RWT7_OESDE|nr:hypothetical protein OESDEN_24280 [Oesophagostomum dentatum]